MPDFSPAAARRLTFALELVAGLCVEALQQDAHVLVELVPVAVDDVEHGVVLDLALLQLVDATAQLLVGSVVPLQTLKTTPRHAHRTGVRQRGRWQVWHGMKNSSSFTVNKYAKEGKHILVMSQKQQLCIFADQ